MTGHTPLGRYAHSHSAASAFTRRGGTCLAFGWPRVDKLGSRAVASDLMLEDGQGATLAFVGRHLGVGVVVVSEQGGEALTLGWREVVECQPGLVSIRSGPIRTRCVSTIGGRCRCV